MKKIKAVKTIDQIIEIIENDGIKIDKYEEDGKHCGYELNTYSDDGVNLIVFLDFRDFKENGNVNNVNDFINEFNSYMNDFDIDNTIIMYREDPSYKATFTLSQSLKDLNSWKKDMLNLIKKISK